MSFEEYKGETRASSQVSTPDSSRSGASTQICGFEVALAPSGPSGVVHRRVNSGELSAKGTSLLSRQLNSRGSSEDETSPSPKLRIRTPRRRLDSHHLRDDVAPGSGRAGDRNKEVGRNRTALTLDQDMVDVDGMEVKDMKDRESGSMVDAPVGHILIHSL
ncbi:hypothetical protein HOP50_06g46090 [Chloropicon primus]|uniref:Uncharacterized protein n=1 Tax=Chloropicon primus TaxID=1764295 RepID=A0A5B8MNT9_9CHLO|nr:hypothetical protein A3770_06p45850 [Chloropicon primus]UPR01287.1 hypothetical protein HOP50_06g46090 [Chloropicon primus]|eukprot:QDZ22067.1 hypothetical protein A3770_06p45850 [Chloropicon primus]